MFTTRQPYIFDKENLVLPLHLRAIIPRKAYDAFSHACQAASEAFRALKIVESRHAYRFRAMCSRANSTHYEKHVESIRCLLDWTQNDGVYNPTLAPSPKISADVLHFHVDQRTYDAYVVEYAYMLESFISVPYRNWLKAKVTLERTISSSGMSEMDQCQWRRWWNSAFLAEMAKWESRVEGLVVPSWEEIIDEVYQAILERVDSAKPLVDSFYVNSGISRI
ncbi:hypothetical protein ASPWEDRAFT_186958 [Aspergillus wentii DTO 134E9]|uniref:Uncharacterized protein n=1 Tax=Aspergillus wentii DTO 134E9 TaxID=1073089 RepID=A0A1L9R816_ASPWE|nr:uncharacterized protein ASPWEDRAFT_186958 [Aspergillus wentii DTO 134E9]KAI9927636.1 hypothetical protein MW887_003257 [Aspergillus wentii]OJJ31017.1 hypothetical protein ASPWEDRAFT_186958 [Aspergillus wentii DTO 134E9]